jgi:hypothetical protein
VFPQVCKQHGWSNAQYISNVDVQFQKWGVVGNTFLTSSGDQVSAFTPTFSVC